MDFDAAAPAPVTEEVLPSVATENDDSEDLGAAYDRITGGKPVEDEPTETAEPEAAEPEETIQEAVIDPAPTDLPLAVKAAWGEMPPDAREAVAKSHREMSQKLAEQGRLVQGISPIRDAMVEAAKLAPHLSSMTPAQVAGEVVKLVSIGQDLSARPVETLAKLAKIHGIEGDLAQFLGGQPVSQGAQNEIALRNEITTLKQQLQRVSDPEYFREQVAAVTSQERALNDVQSFAGSAEHWADVEPHLPKIIPLVREQLGQSASAQDVLARSYDLALSIYVPDAKAKPQTAEEATPAAAPKTAEAAIRAKSVNVTGRPSGATRELSERDRMSAIYDRAMKK
jgi:hypothetical protein